MMEDQIENMLNMHEARVLGVLMEKQMTTPDYYPLTLKALITGCNQKSSRIPVMALSLGEVGGVTSGLRSAGLVTARMDGRADRFEQHLSRKLHLSLEMRAILCVLMLRGALTQNEIRIATSRMVDFNDAKKLASSMSSLMTGDDHLISCLGHGNGQREDRYAHCLCGQPAVIVAEKSTTTKENNNTQAQRIAQLEHDVAELKTALHAMRMRIQRDPACLSGIDS
ncbi:MAG: DUF480 domain-containing protein [Mariprofundaceae bacterium]|nr:DUF480 domain-containing protein [Mariprofundaceae bacterium]